MSQTDLGNAFNLSYSAIAKYELGTASIPGELFLVLQDWVDKHQKAKSCPCCGGFGTIPEEQALICIECPEAQARLRKGEHTMDKQKESKVFRPKDRSASQLQRKFVDRELPSDDVDEEPRTTRQQNNRQVRPERKGVK